MEINSTVLSNGVTYGNVDFKCELQDRDKNNCSVRSLASAFKVSYKKAYYTAQAIWDRAHNNGISGFDVAVLDGMKLWGRKSERMGEVIMSQEGDYKLFTDKKLGKWYPVGGGEKRFRQMSAGTFFKTYKEGTYILVVTGHMFAYVNGEVQGNYSDATKLKRTVNHAFKIG